MHVWSVASVLSDFLRSQEVDRQAPLSLGFSRQEYWSGLPHPPPGDLSNPAIKHCPLLQADTLVTELGLPVHHQLPEFTQTHIHRVIDAI